MALTCEKCRRDTDVLYTWHIDNGENGSLQLCGDCFDQRAGRGAYDPENRDWDAEREAREDEGDY